MDQINDIHLPEQLDMLGPDAPSGCQVLQDERLVP